MMCINCVFMNLHEAGGNGRLGDTELLQLTTEYVEIFLLSVQCSYNYTD